MAKDKANLEKFKQDYTVLKQKHSLPDFEFLNQNFDIEAVAAEETEVLLKKIRKQIVEKLSSGLRSLELFLNPQTAPMFILKIIKSFSQTDKDILEELYNKFAIFEIEAFGLENKYDEAKEIEFIKKISKAWPEICEDFDRIQQSMKVNYKKESKKNEKSYLR